MNPCNRCQGLLILEQDEWHGAYVPRCVQCGNRPMVTPPLPPLAEGQKIGPFLPVVVEM